MSVDKLQDKIRKTKNPSVIDFTVLPTQIPPYLLESEGAFLPAYVRFCRELMTGLQGSVPAVRFSFGYFALHGPEGLVSLAQVLQFAENMGYYIFLDVMEMLSGQSAAYAADILLNSSELKYDALIVTAYIGSDGLRPYAEKLKDLDKALFPVIRTGNRSASEVQDLLTGSRLVHLAKADIANRFAESLVGRSGYSKVGIMAAATSVDSLKSLRSKFAKLFFLLDGYDYPNANAKNCSYAFDNLGHGAVACAGSSITAAWQQEQSDGWQYVQQAVDAAERMKKNLTRYVTIL